MVAMVNHGPKTEETKKKEQDEEYSYTHETGKGVDDGRRW